MIPDTLTSVQLIEKGVKTLIFTLEMAKKMLAVQWVLGNGLVVLMTVMVFMLPFILRRKARIDETIRQYPKGWAFLASRILQGVRVFFVKRWYVVYILLIAAGVLVFNVTPHLIPVPASAEFVFQKLG
jgi:hypothetical protein